MSAIPLVRIRFVRSFWTWNFVFSFPSSEAGQFAGGLGHRFGSFDRRLHPELGLFLG